MQTKLYFPLVLLTFIACKQKQETTQTTTTIIPVKTIPIEKKDIPVSIQATGIFTTEDETLLSFKTGGILTAVVVKEGDFVRKGQVLATINPTEINTYVQQAQLGLEKAKRDYERAAKLYKDSVATYEQMQNAKTALDVAKEQVLSAQFNKDYTILKALKDGYVLKKMAFDGQIVGPGMPVLLVNGAGSNQWMLKVGVSDKEWAAIKLGDEATITTDVSTNSQFKAVVSKKSEGIDATSGTFWVNLTPKTAIPNLATGVFGKAVIQPKVSLTAWELPFDAILDGDTQEGFVFITNNQQTVEKRKIQINGIQHQKVLVTNGLDSAKWLIVEGNAYLTDKSCISVKP